MPITETTSPRRIRTKISWEIHSASNPRYVFSSVFDIERDLDEGWLRIDAWWIPSHEMPHIKEGMGPTLHAYMSWIAQHSDLGVVREIQMMVGQQVVYIDGARPELEIFFEALARELEDTREAMLGLRGFGLERAFSIYESALMEHDGGSSTEPSAAVRPARRI